MGIHKEAIESFKQAVKINPDDADAHYNLGAAYSKSGKYQEAIESYKQVIRIDPDGALAHTNLGVVYAESGTDIAEVHYNLGLAYGKSGMHKEAIESFKQAIRIDPDFAWAHNNLGIAYISSRLRMARAILIRNVNSLFILM